MAGILKNTSIYAFGIMIPQIAGFFLLPVYTKFLTPSDYGIVSSMQVLSTIFLVLMTLSLDRSITRLYFDFKSEQEKRDFLGTITISIFTISIIVLALIFIFKGVVEKIYKSVDFYPFYFYLILTVFFTTYSLIPKLYYQVNEKPGKFVMITLSQFLLSTGFILWYVVIKKDGAEGMLKGNLMASIVILPVMIYVSVRSINFRFRSKIFKESVAFSLPMIPGFLSAWLLNQSDRVFIERYLGLNEVGIYSLAYKLASIVTIVSSAFNSAYSPIFYKLANTESAKTAKEKLSKFNNIFIIIIMILTFLLIFYSKEGVLIFFNPKYAAGYKLIPIVALAMLIGQSQGIYNLMIYQEKKVIQMVLIGVLGGITNLPLNFLLIPKMGAYGAALATLIAFFIMYVAALLYSKKCYYIPLNWRAISKVGIGLIIIYFSSEMLLGSVSIYWSLIIKTFICLGILTYAFFKYYKKLKALLIKY